MPTARLVRRSLTRLGLASALALTTACAPRSGGDDTRRADIPKAAATPAPVTMTPVRFDAYLLALRNIYAAHPTFVVAGSNPEVVREEMRDAVGRAGLTLEEFRSLHAQVHADPFLKAEAQRRLDAMPQGPARSGAPEPSPARPEPGAQPGSTPRP